MTLDLAKLRADTLALTEWQAQDFDDEPCYWHRHPNTGRRREYKDDGTFTETVTL